MEQREQKAKRQTRQERQTILQTRRAKREYPITLNVTQSLTCLFMVF